jgi:dipeptidyl aminopeptidase/acylaminoacyl peptidase
MRARRVIRTALFCYAVFCAILAIFLGELAFRPQRIGVQPQSAQTAAARFGAVLQDVSVTASDGNSLRGWFARPANGNGDIVMLFHGVGDNRQGMMGFAELFLANGFAVLLPDSRAHGESGGDFPTYGIKESSDVRHWFDWLESEQHPKCVFGMGESMGAAILLQAIEKENRFCAVVAESSFASFRQIAYVRVGQLLHTGAWLGKVALRPAVEMAFLYGRFTRGVNLADASPERSVVGSRVPIFLIHGLADNNIPPEQSEQIRAHNPAEIVLWEVPNAGHCGAVDAAGAEFDKRVPGWFNSHDRFMQR